jgi:hypothetical protein
MPNSDASTLDPVLAAFHDLHNKRLYGFALLLTLGDEPQAATLTGSALREGGRRVSELRHPERAAAWLRARVVRASRETAAGESPAERTAVLRQLAVQDHVAAGLGSLDRLARAAVIAASIEGMSLPDVAAIVGQPARRVQRLLRDARAAYAHHAAAAMSPDEAPRGTTVDRVRSAVARTLT